MQTLHLRFRDLRAILLGETPSRWPTPSLRAAATWKGALPLPNLPRPTLAVGAHPETSHQRLDRCPTVGAGLTMASPFREVWIVGPDGADPHRVCPRQTACHLPPYPAPHEAGDLGVDDRQARASTTLRAVSPRLSFPRRAAHQIGVPIGTSRTGGQKTADRTANVGALAGVSSGACRRRLRLRRGLR
jgi:hypothetical protein